MKTVSLIRSTGCFLVLLFLLGASLRQPAASTREGNGQEAQVQDRERKPEDGQKREAKKRKVKEEDGKIAPAICNDCDPGDGGGGGGGGGSTGDGHKWCNGWDRQGDCAFNHINVAASVEFRRQKNVNDYD